jgi:16S rRNA (uracil1498-N3)-methyltransferase
MRKLEAVMRANYKLQRLYVEAALGAGLDVPLAEAQSHYLRAVLRMEGGEPVLVFNGRDGEWQAHVAKVSKRGVALQIESQTRAQDPKPGLTVLFAPLKVGRLDYLVQKCVEMGAGTLCPVITAFTQNRNLQVPKLQAWALEAAEQCGILAVPDILAPAPLATVLQDWPKDRRLIFCDEASESQNPLAAISHLIRDPWTPLPLGVLIGPEGGFSDEERATLRALPFVTAIPLGPRILRADTAGVAALAIVQAALGDWR